MIDNHSIDMGNTTFKVGYMEPNATEQLAATLQSIFMRVPAHRPIVFICIGTDRSTGDALGPLVGSYLHRNRLHTIPTIGTVDEPVHAINLADTIQNVFQSYSHPFIVGVDACLGKLAHVGHIQVGYGPVKPGAGVNKELPPVGDIHITAIVNVGGFMEYFVLQNTRLSVVMKMAEIISESCYLSLLYSKRISTPIAKVDTFNHL